MRGAATTSLILSSSLALASAGGGLRGSRGSRLLPARRDSPKLADLIAEAIRDTPDGGDGEGPAAKRRRRDQASSPTNPPAPGPGGLTRAPRPTRPPTGKPVVPGGTAPTRPPQSTTEEGAGPTLPTLPAGGPTRPPTRPPAKEEGDGDRSAVSPTTTATTTEAAQTSYWYPAAGDGCVYGNDYHPSMLTVHEEKYPLLFKSEEECCAVHCRVERDGTDEDGDSVTEDPADPTATSTTTATTAVKTSTATAAATTATAKPSYWYRKSVLVDIEPWPIRKSLTSFAPLLLSTFFRRREQRWRSVATASTRLTTSRRCSSTTRRSFPCCSTRRRRVVRSMGADWPSTPRRTGRRTDRRGRTRGPG